MTVNVSVFVMYNAYAEHLPESRASIINGCSSFVILKQHSQGSTLSPKEHRAEEPNPRHKLAAIVSGWWSRQKTEQHCPFLI